MEVSAQLLTPAALPPRELEPARYPLDNEDRRALETVRTL
jgi:hypothetical protein